MELPFLAGLPLVLTLDRLSGIVLVAVLAVSALVLAASVAEIGERRRSFYALMALFVLGVVLTVTAGSLLPLLIGWELMGAMSYALIALHGHGPRAPGSGSTAFLTTRAADLGMYAAAGALYAGTGTLDLAALPSLTGWPLHLATAGLIAAALGKAAQLPFSFWLMRAMDGPSSVSALLHSAAMVAMGGYLLLRVEPLLTASGWGSGVVAGVGVSTALLMGLVAVVQTDLKLLLAASTASQLGFVVLAAGVGGVTGGTAHLVAHAFVKSSLFLAAGAWLTVLGTRDLDQLRGAGRRTPVLGIVFAVSGLALAGLPPLSLWVTKDAVLVAAREQSLGLYLVGTVAALLAAVYAARAVAIVLRTPSEPRVRLPRLAWVPLVPLAVGAALSGLLALPPLAETLLPGTPEPVSVLALTLAGAVALLGAGWAFPRAEGLAGPVDDVLLDWLHLERAVHAGVVRPSLALSQALAAFDDRVLDRGVLSLPRLVRGAGRSLAAFDDDGLDRAVRGTVPVTLGLAGLSRRTDERDVDGLVQGIASGARRLGELARRPQTGQLHTYLAQAAVALAVAVLLLLVVR